MSEELSQETISKQKKIELAQSDYAPVVLEILKDCMRNTPLIDKKSQWTTVVNAITLDVQGTLLRDVADYLESIRKGSLHEPKE